MFKGTTTRFRVAYYLSYLVMPIILTVVFIISRMLVQTVLFQSMSPMQKVFLYSLVVLLLICLYSLWWVKRNIKNLLEYSKSRGSMSEFKLDRVYSGGIWKSALICVIPLLSVFCFDTAPIVSISVFYGTVIAMYFLYSSSSEIIPNTSLSLAGYSLFVVREVGAEKPKVVYAFGNIRKTTKGVGRVIYLDLSDKSKVIGLFKENK